MLAGGEGGAPLRQGIVMAIVRQREDHAGAPHNLQPSFQPTMGKSSRSKRFFLSYRHVVPSGHGSFKDED